MNPPLEENTLLQEIENLKNIFIQNKNIYIDSFNHLRRSSNPKKNQESIELFKEKASFELKEKFPTFEDFLCCYNNNLLEVPKCPFCGKNRMFFANGIAKYAATCGHSPCKDLQKSKTNRDNHNGQHSSSMPEVIAQVLSTKERKLQEGIYDSINNYRKARQTYFQKTGYYHPMNNPEVKNKVKETNLKNHGGRWAISCPEIQEKSKATLLEKTGYEYPSQNPITKEKIRNTTFKHYNVYYNSQSPIIRQKIKNTLLKRYGVINPSQDPEIRKKAQGAIQKTWALKYKGGNPLRDERVLKKLRSKYTYKNITFDSSYELAVYIYYERRGIFLERTPVTDYTYIGIDSKVHKYVPDFKDPRDGHLIEVKDSHWMRGENYKNLIFKVAEVIWDVDHSIDIYLEEMKNIFGSSNWYRQFKNYKE